MIPELRQLLVEVLDGGLALPEKIGNEALLAILDCLQVRKDFLNIVLVHLKREPLGGSMVRHWGMQVPAQVPRELAQ